jgi:hypothetical protein
MDLFSRFPESNTQGQILSKINDDLIDSDRFEMQESKEDINPQGNLRFESLQKVNSLRKRNLIMMIILLSLILFFSYIIPNILINISLILIEKYSIKDKSTIEMFSYIYEICVNVSYIFSIILYLYYPLNYSFTYIFSLIITEYIYSLIFITYGIDREKEKNIQQFFFNGSEKPNLQILRIVVIFFGFWRLLKSKSRNKKEINKYKKINNIIFIISIIITLIIFLEQIFVEKYSIKSCFLGLFLGFLIYSIIYERICFQFMKPNFFLLYINGNYWLFVFTSLIPLLIVIYMFNNYNKMKDVFEKFKYNPFYLTSNINIINQVDMNRICLIKSFIVFLLLFSIKGIKDNYDFVTSRKSNNFYNLSDIVLFNKHIKELLIIKNIVWYIISGISLIGFIGYINYYSDIQFIYILFMEIIIYYIFGKGLFGYGIKSMLKPNLDEERELDNYPNMEFSSGSTPKNDEKETEGRL